METYRDIILHSGVKGMKWGVWNEETRARYTGQGGRSKSRAKRIDKNLTKAEVAKIQGKTKKYEKFQKKAAYLKELEEPGSTKLPTNMLKRKRAKNLAGTLYAGSSVVNAILMSGNQIMQAPLYATVFGPVGGPIVTAGTFAASAIVASKWADVTVDSLRRAGDLNTTISNRNTKKAAESAKYSRKRSSKDSSNGKKVDERDIFPMTGEKYDSGFLKSGIRKTKAYKSGDREFLKEEYKRYYRDPKGYKPLDTK